MESVWTQGSAVYVRTLPQFQLFVTFYFNFKGFYIRLTQHCKQADFRGSGSTAPWYRLQIVEITLVLGTPTTETNPPGQHIYADDATGFDGNLVHTLQKYSHPFNINFKVFYWVSNQQVEHNSKSEGQL